MCAGIVFVTLNNNKEVNELFILYCSFSHLIEPAMFYRLECILNVMHHTNKLMMMILFQASSVGK